MPVLQNLYQVYKLPSSLIVNNNLKLEVKIIKQKGPIGVGEALATCDGKIVAKDKEKVNEFCRIVKEEAL